MPTRLDAVKIAERYIGVKEHPPGSNRGAQIDKWNRAACGMVGVYWCASFIHGVFKEAGYTLPGGASVANIHSWAKSIGIVVKRPFRGDLALYSWDHPFQHIGIVERVLSIKIAKWGGYYIQTIEGNTSSGTAGSQDNGGGVFRRRRVVRASQVEFVRVHDKSKKVKKI